MADLVSHSQWVNFLPTKLGTQRPIVCLSTPQRHVFFLLFFFPFLAFAAEQLVNGSRPRLCDMFFLAPRRPGHRKFKGIGSLEQRMRRTPMAWTHPSAGRLSFPLKGTSPPRRGPQKQVRPFCFFVRLQSVRTCYLLGNTSFLCEV